MYLVACFISSFALVALPVIFFQFIDTIVELGSIGITLRNVVFAWSIYLSWLVAPIVGREIARMVFFSKSKIKGKKMPPDANNGIIITSILATILGYIVLFGFIFFTLH
jgi:hypothetical protein